ncbi:Uncharacterized protein APZ42_029624 [Daphnia magna]|uniref:Uncharacterized protein n=1 Tax=Daphnia magna TaxID=35525 RepID=A0A0P5XV18_9CRUS|nr:Uncharacterized protein APZ42_029624 [Daphnia magna]
MFHFLEEPLASILYRITKRTLIFIPINGAKWRILCRCCTLKRASTLGNLLIIVNLYVRFSKDPITDMALAFDRCVEWKYS